VKGISLSERIINRNKSERHTGACNAPLQLTVSTAPLQLTVSTAPLKLTVLTVPQQTMPVAPVAVFIVVSITRKNNALMTFTQNSATALIQQPVRVNVALALLNILVDEMKMVIMIL